MNYSMVCAVLGCVFVVACGGSSNETIAGPGGGAGGGSGGIDSGAGGNTASGGSAGNTASGGGPGVGTAGQGGGATISEGPCKPITACGGNIVGTWRVSELCTPNLMSTQASVTCPGETVTLSALTESGTYTFNADNTTLDNLHIAFTEMALLPTSCATEAQCTQIEAAYATVPGVTSTTCSYAAAGCSCLLAVDTQVSSMGNYQINGSDITLTASTTATPETDTFCVSGNTLRIQNINADGAVANLTLTK